jgi:hypothetical protein
MYTKKQIEETEKYLSEQGYGTGSNFTVKLVANLMAEWEAKNCSMSVVKSSAFKDELIAKTHSMQKTSDRMFTESHRLGIDSALSSMRIHIENIYKKHLP